MNMLRQDIDGEDLRSEICSLRKHITRVCGENQILKVKIRKLQEEMIKRDKQLDEFLNSKRLFGYSKSFQEKGASVLLNLKLKNEKLEQILLEKDLLIRRLHNTLQTAKLYNAQSLSKRFLSKGTECSLVTDRYHCQKKGRSYTKIDLHMPRLDMDHFEKEEDVPEEIPLSRRRPNSVESQFLLDINFDLKQRNKPFYSESIYGSSSQHQMETKESKSDGNLESCRATKRIDGLLPDYLQNNGDFRTKGQYQLQENQNVGSRDLINPTFRKILQTVEDLMLRGAVSTEIYKNSSVDQAVQFPTEEHSESFESYLSIASPNQGNYQSSMIHNKVSNRDIKIKTRTSNNKLPATVLEEIEVQDQSDVEGVSVKEKSDVMEKTEIKNALEIKDSEKPHEEIKQLHVYLMDMISQVDNLKETISQMKAEQEKTENDLKSKNESIEKLAKEIVQLREYRTISCVELNKFTNLSENNLKLVAKDMELNIPESIQRTTEGNHKKFAAKMKHLNESKSKSSIASQPLERKSSKASSKHLKSEKRKNIEKSSSKKLEKKSLKGSESKKFFGIGNGDVEIPFYRCNFAPVSIVRNEFDELD